LPAILEYEDFEKKVWNVKFKKPKFALLIYEKGTEICIIV